MLKWPEEWAGGDMKKFRNVIWYIAFVAASLLIPAWFTSGALENEYVTYPREPHPERGQIVAHQVKGITVYVAVQQQQLLTWLVRF
jgi:hypothetical protein